MAFMPITRVDTANRMVWARLDETPGLSGHVMDYDASKPFFTTWSERMAKASGGANLGNVRAMHSRKAAGMVKSFDCDDAAKTMLFGIYISDDAELENCASGLYTGISPGGKMRKFVAGSQIRFEARPDELSLVDAPDNPNATFMTMNKASGMEEAVPFAPIADLEAIVEAMAKCASPGHLAGLVLSLPTTTIVRMFGNDAERAPEEVMEKRAFSAADRRDATKNGVALPDGSFAIVNKDDLAAAITAIDRASDGPATRAHIIARAEALDAVATLSDGWRGAIVPMKKSMDEVGAFARILQDVSWLASNVTSEAASEGDGSTVPAQIAAWLRAGIPILTAMAGEESNELLQRVMAGVAALPVLAVAQDAAEGAVDDTMVVLADGVDVMAKAAGIGRVVSMASELAQLRAARTEDMAKFAGDRASFETTRATLQARVTQLEALPRAGGASVRAVSKESDGVEPPKTDQARAAVDAMPAGIDRARVEMSLALGVPQALLRNRTI